MDEAENCVLDPQYDTLPQLLSQRGYTTSCLSTNAFLSEATGINKGFDNFKWLRKSKSGIFQREMLIPVLKYLTSVRTYGPGITLDGRQHNFTYILGEQTRKTTTSLSDDEPYFLYIHPSNPHHPYAPPLKYREKFFDDIEFTPEEAIELSFEVYESQDAVKRQIANGPDLTTKEWDAIRALYDAEIAYVDEFVGWVYDYIQSMSENTIFIVTGDHGDLFGEQGVIGHNLVLDDGLTHVPMVIEGLSGIEKNTDEIIQHIDVTRTLASELGIESDQFQGQDLTGKSEGFAISQRGRIDLDRYRNYNAAFSLSDFHEAPLSMILDEQFKLLYSTDRVELVEPPEETVDVSSSNSKAYQRLENCLKETLQEMRSSEQTLIDRDAEFTDEMRDQLSDLGYL